MHDIIFRGLRLDGGGWVTSSSILILLDESGGKLCYMPKKDDLCFCTYDDKGNSIGFDSAMFYAVDPETVGQSVGLKDADEREIFEGDILKYRNEITVVKWQGTRLVALRRNRRPMSWQLLSDCCRIIGNIHDNPTQGEIGGQG